MGTNYYIHNNKCQICGRYEEIHLGKSSSGWQFSFQYNDGKFYKNVNEMKKWLKNKQIYDEYDKKISYDDFWKMVNEKQKNINHAQRHPSENDFVIGGFSFTNCWFS